MSYYDLTRPLVWLLVDDGGIIIAICGNPEIANTCAKALGVDVERSRAGAFEVGDTLPMVHC